MPVFEIWCEGYVATGEKGEAHFFGVHEGNNFEAAVNNFFAARGTIDLKPDGSSFFNKETLTYWGCKLFDNERDARKSYG